MEVGPASGDVGADAGPSSSALVLGQSSETVIVDRTKHPSGIEPTLQNIVATVDLGVKLELKTIALGARNAEYNPKVCPHATFKVISLCQKAVLSRFFILQRFAAVIIRIRDPKTTALVFASGKMVKIVILKCPAAPCMNSWRETWTALPQVVTGAKNEDLAKTAARKVSDMS